MTTTIDIGLTPMGVAVAPDGNKVYVANEALNGTVSVIDTATNAVSATVAVGRHPVGVAVKPDGSKVYVANRVMAPYRSSMRPIRWSRRSTSV